MNRLSVTLIFIAAILLTPVSYLMSDPPEVLKIAVIRNGKVTANGKPTTTEALDSICRDLAGHKGEVWYYREAPKEEPHPIAVKILDIIIRYNLPVRLSSKPDYSDAINERGESVQPC
jgi:hypothetical protein